MSLKDKLLDELKIAMKTRDQIKKNTIQLVRASVLQIEKDEKKVLDDDGVIQVISKEVKKRKDSIPEFEKGQRLDLVQNINKEIEVLLEYLPEQLTEKEIDKLVNEAILVTGATSLKDMGKIMNEVLPKVQGRADGRAINQSVKKYLK